MSPKLLHLGCGTFIGPHWHNVDSSPNVFLDNHRWLKWLLYPILPASSRQAKFQGAHYLDMRKKWRFESGAYDAVYSSHFFEHLSFTDGQHVLKEAFRVLKPGGRVRFLLPSIELETKRYLERKQSDPLAATWFATTTCVFSAPPKGRWWYDLYFQLYDKNTHKMFYDSSSLKYYLKMAGFVDVQDKNYLQSEIPHLDEVEKQDRFGDTVCVEGRKP